MRASTGDNPANQPPPRLRRSAEALRAKAEAGSHSAAQRKAAEHNVAEYLIEAAALGTFMVSAAVFTTLLFHPASPVTRAVHNETLRRGLMGLAMGGTAMSIVYSPWGQRSGAHMNPALTLTFFRLGKVSGRLAFGYITAQVIGAAAGMLLATATLRDLVAHPSVNYVVTRPGGLGPAVAFLAELMIAFGMMLTVLTMTNTRRLARWTGVVAGLLVCVYITFEAPLSGMSMNPARTFGSDFVAGSFPGFWIYLVAPTIGMLAAAELYVRRRGLTGVICAKLHHPAAGPCVFGCDAKPAAPPNIEAA